MSPEKVFRKWQRRCDLGETLIALKGALPARAVSTKWRVVCVIEVVFVA